MNELHANFGLLKNCSASFEDEPKAGKRERENWIATGRERDQITISARPVIFKSALYMKYQIRGDTAAGAEQNGCRPPMLHLCRTVAYPLLCRHFV